MALQTELLSLLDNSDEPLSKRLRIATDVFNANDLPAFNKENVLFDWFGKTSLKTETTDIWDTFHACVTSSHMKDISFNEVKHNVLSNVVKAVIKQLKKELEKDLINNVVKCGIAMLKTNLFEQYFKHDLKHYCGLVSAVLLNVEDANLIREIITLNLSFNNKNFDKTEYTTHFLSSTLEAIIKVLIKFQDDTLYESALKLIYLAVFSSNSNDIINFLTRIFEQNEYSNELSTNIIFDKLNILYMSDAQTAKFGFKIFFLSSLRICNTETLRYQLFILMLHIIGFKVKKSMKINLPRHDGTFNLEKSIEILAEIFEVMHKKNIIIKESLSGTTFPDFLKSVIVSVIRIQTQPSIGTFKILKYVIDIEPLIVENSINEILPFISLSRKEDNLQLIYSELMISIITMYFKLRRFGKFYSVVLETIHNKIFSKLKSSKAEIKFNGDTKATSSDTACFVKDVLPENVLHYIQECVALQSSVEVNRILRTCIYNLKQITDEFQSYADDRKVFFVQIVSEVICNLLSGIKLADTKATDYSCNKIINDMNSLREHLKKFGTALLTVEHNHLLMFSFLNICYTWAEVAILLTFYTTSENLNFKGEIENDTSANNLTYLHNYLSTEQWSLVSQRIKNFGEQPCKHILQKLLVQKLRAMFIFETKVNEKIESSIISNYANNLETSWNIMLSEKFIVAFFIPKMESSQLIILAEFFIKHIIPKNNYELLNQQVIIDSRDLMTSVFYVCLSKINELFKRKRKHGHSVNIKPICINIFKSIDEDSFIKSEKVDIEKIVEYFSDTFSEIQDFKINEESFCTFMEIIKYIPVIALSFDIQVTLFLYLLSICSDLRNCKEQNIKCLEKCEEYLIALVENHLFSPNILSYIKSDVLIKYIMESVEKYKILLSFIIGKGLTQNDTIRLYKPALNMLEKNMSEDKYLEIVFIMLRVINNSFLKNVTEENIIVLKKYKEKLYKKLLKRIIANEDISDNSSIAYIWLLENYLDNDTEDILAKLIPLLKQYIDYVIRNINESNAEEFLLLFNLILSKKSAITDVPEDFNMCTWKACKDLNKVDKYKHFNNILKLLSEDSSVNDFSIILQELLETNLRYLKSNETVNVITKLQIWKNLLRSNLSNEKIHAVQNMITMLFGNLVVFLTSNNNNQELNEEFVSFQLNLIENQKLILSPSVVDVHFQTTQILLSKEYKPEKFITSFETSFPILESLAKFRKELLIDRLPTFLLHFRLYLHHLCLTSNSNNNLNSSELIKITDCAFRIEKLIRIICSMKKDIVKLSPYLIADFLKEYEKNALYPEVKHHLNNCLMELVALCDDKHAVSYLLRVLSPASTELFKELHNHYNKYYKFSGKV